MVGEADHLGYSHLGHVGMWVSKDVFEYEILFLDLGKG